MVNRKSIKETLPDQRCGFFEGKFAPNIDLWLLAFTLLPEIEGAFANVAAVEAANGRSLLRRRPRQRTMNQRTPSSRGTSGGHLENFLSGTEQPVAPAVLTSKPSSRRTPGYRGIPARSLENNLVPAGGRKRSDKHLKDVSQALLNILRVLGNSWLPQPPKTSRQATNLPV